MNTESAGCADPDWRRYFVWPWDYFPITLPSCRVERTQQSHSVAGEARITWRMDTDLPLIARIDDEVGVVLGELLPEPGDGRTFETTHKLPTQLLGQTIGFAFLWGFYVPLVSYVTGYPMGIVKVAGSELRGRDTVFTITDTRGAQQSR